MRDKNWKNKKYLTSDLFPFQEPAYLVPSISLGFICTRAALAERKGHAQEHFAAYFPTMIQVPQTLDIKLPTRHRAMFCTNYLSSRQEYRPTVSDTQRMSSVL